MLQTLKISQSSLSPSQLLQIAEEALEKNDYSKAIPLLERIAEIKLEQKALPTDLADAYYDVGEKYFLAATQKNNGLQAIVQLTQALHYIKLAIATYPDSNEQDVGMCADLISKILIQKNNLTLNVTSVSQPQITNTNTQDTARFSTKRMVTTEHELVDADQEENDYEDEDDDEDEKKSARVRYRDQLIEGKMIKSVKVNGKTATIELYPVWQDQKSQRGILKMFTEIARDRSLFKTHLERKRRSSSIEFDIIKNIEQNTPEAIQSFIIEQAKKKLAPSFLKMMREGKLIKRVEIDDGYAVFHIEDDHNTPDNLRKINTCLYNEYIKNKGFSANFGIPVKNGSLPKMHIKAQHVGKTADEIRLLFINILNKLPINDASVAVQKVHSMHSKPVVSSTVRPDTKSWEPLAQPDPSLVGSLQKSFMLPEFDDNDLKLFDDSSFSVSQTLTFQYDTSKDDFIKDAVLPSSPKKQRFGFD